MRLLLIDDDTLTRRALARKLRSLGHAIRPCRSIEGATGRAADAWLLVARPAHWHRTMAWLRSRALGEAAGPTWVLVLAPEACAELRLEASEAGADAVLPLAADDREWRTHLAVAARVWAREAAHNARDHELERALAAARHGLDAASAMQRALLPPASRACPGARTAWSFIPSENVAGDLLSVHALDETRTAFYLLDVAGHGVPAAMFAFSLNLVLRPRRPGEVPFHAGALVAPDDLLGSPGELLMELNRRYQDDSELPRHFSIVYGVLDAARGSVRIAQAGLPPPLIQRGGSLLERSLPGPPLGLLRSALYDEIELGIEPGDRLYLYSDGVSECPDPQRQPFQTERLCGVLDQHRDDDLVHIVQAVERALRLWRGDDRFPDDVSFLALEAA